MRLLSSLILLSLWFGVSVAGGASKGDILQMHSPKLVGNTLYIYGRIDSHIYDFLSLERAALEQVKVIDLNSFGGNHHWALDIAKKIAELGKETKIRNGSVCASSCVYLFTSGKKRIIENEVWLGVHGARIPGSYKSSFDGYCFIDLEDGRIFNEKLKNCSEFLTLWYSIAFKATVDAFDFFEQNGVSVKARDYYFNLNDDPLWYEKYNVFKKPDWIIVPDDALALGFAHRIDVPSTMLVQNE